MSYPAIRVPAREKHTSTFIFMHGLGDNGRGWTFLADEAQRQNKLGHVKFIFPDAPVQPVSLNYGMAMPAWYDIKSLSNVWADQDEEGVLASIERLKQMVAAEVEAGIPTTRIVIGGFSQGCALSLSTSVLSNDKFAGVVAISGYLPIHEHLLEHQTEVNKSTPLFYGYGTADNVVKFSAGQFSRDVLVEKLGRNVRWHEYVDMVHTASPAEVKDILAFLEEVLPEKEDV